MSFVEYQRAEYTISTDPARLDVVLIHRFLNQHSYWAQNRAEDVVRRAVENSLNFGVYHGDQQVGYARVVTDYATFGWVCDVFIVHEYRGRGLSKWLVESLVSHPDLKSIRRLMLATRDAHGLYRNYGGFEPINNPERWMLRFNPEA